MIHCVMMVVCGRCMTLNIYSWGGSVGEVVDMKMVPLKMVWGGGPGLGISVCVCVWVCVSSYHFWVHGPRLRVQAPVVAWRSSICHTSKLIDKADHQWKMRIWNLHCNLPSSEHNHSITARDAGGSWPGLEAILAMTQRWIGEGLEAILAVTQRWIGEGSEAILAVTQRWIGEGSQSSSETAIPLQEGVREERVHVHYVGGGIPNFTSCSDQ